MALFLLGEATPAESASLRTRVQQFTDQLATHWPRDMVGFAPDETIDLLALTSKIYSQVLDIYIDMLENSLRFRFAQGALEQVERISNQLTRKADAVHFGSRISQLKKERAKGTEFVQIPGFRDAMIALLLEIGSAMDAVVILNQNVAPDALVKASLLLAGPGAGWYSIFDSLADRWNAFVKKIETAVDGVTTAAEAIEQKVPSLPTSAAIDRKIRVATIVGGIAGAGILGTLIYVAVKHR